MDKLFRFWVVLGFLGLSFGVSAKNLTLTVIDPTPDNNKVSFLADGQPHTVRFHIEGSGLAGSSVELRFSSLPSEITATGTGSQCSAVSSGLVCTFTVSPLNMGIKEDFDIDFSSATEALYALDKNVGSTGNTVNMTSVDLKFVQPVLVTDNNSLQAFWINSSGNDIEIDHGDEVLRYSKVKYQATAGIYNATGGVYTMGSVRLSMTGRHDDLSSISPAASAFDNCNLTNNILSCLSNKWPNNGADNNNATFFVEGRVVTDAGESQQLYSAKLTEICGYCRPNSYNETDSFSVVSGQDVAVSFDGLPTGTMDVGDEFEFTVKVENNSEAPNDVDTSAFPGANYAVEPTVKVTLPDELEFVSGSGCSGTTNLSCSMGPLTKGNDADLTIGVRVKNVGDAPNKATAAITATVDAGNNDERPGYDANNTVTASVTVATYDVNLNNIIAAPNAVNVGDEFDYTAVINNPRGSATIDFRYQKLEMTTTLNGMSFVGLDTGDANRWECNQNGSQLVCTTKQRTETMGTGSFSFTPKLRAPSSINGTSEVISVPSELKLLDRNSGAELASSSNTVSVTVNSTAAPYALSLTKTASVSEVTVGEDFEYGFMVTNSGSAALQDVVLTDTLPSGVVYRGYRGSGWVCDMSGGVLSCRLGTAGTTLAGGASNNDLVLEVTAPSVVGTVNNTAEVLGFDGNQQQQASANGSVSVEVKARVLSSDLAVSLSSDAGNLLAGDAFVVTAMTENKGPDAVSDGVLSMSVSGAVSTVSLVDGGAWSGCQVTGLSVVCPPQDLSNGFASAVKFNVVLDGQLTAASQVGVVATISSSANDPNSGNNSDNLDYQVSLQPTEVELLEHMRDVAGPVDEQSDQAMQNIASFCDRDFDTAIEAGVCENLWNSTSSDQDNLRQMIKEVTPNEVITQSASAAEIMTSQFRNVDARLAELRGGGGGFSLAGLTARYGDQSLPLGMLAYLGADGDAKDRNSSSDFVSPWGFFVNGTVSMGERDSTGREVGFDFDTYGITAGLDYRFSPSKVIGLALGYANFDSELDDEQGEVQSAGFTLTGYGSFYVNDHFYVDSRISYGRPDFEQKRRVQFNLGNLQVDRVASGETEADQYTAAVSMGYHFNKNAWVITPNLTARYTHTSIGAFREYGAGGYNMSYEEQDIESMVVTFGLSVSKALSLKRGVLTPQFDVNMSRELENNGGMIAARFVGATEDEVFWIQTDEPDRTFGNAGLGFVFVGASGKQAYVNYRSVFGLEGFSRGTWNAGLRFEF